MVPVKLSKVILTFFFFLSVGKTAYIENKDTEYLKEWLACLLSVPSHYCRKTNAYKDKNFLYPGTTIVNLHAEYQNSTDAVRFRVVCQARFREVFHQENYSVFIPRKDQCDICVSAKHDNIDDLIFQAHLNSKDQARAEKSADKEAAQERKSVWTMDLQAVLLCPRTAHFTTKQSCSYITSHYLI